MITKKKIEEIKQKIIKTVFQKRLFSLAHMPLAGQQKKAI